MLADDGVHLGVPDVDVDARQGAHGTVVEVDPFQLEEVLMC